MCNEFNDSDSDCVNSVMKNRICVNKRVKSNRERRVKFIDSEREYSSDREENRERSSVFSGDSDREKREYYNASETETEREWSDREYVEYVDCVEKSPRRCEKSGISQPEQSQVESGCNRVSGPRQLHRESKREDFTRRRPYERRERGYEDERSKELRDRSVERTLRVVKLLKAWNLYFTGEESHEDPEEFLERLKDCRASSSVSDGKLLAALPCVFERLASRWFRTVRDSVATWRDFERVFKNQFIEEYDYEDLMSDLRHRTQGKGEKITNFLFCFRHIVSKFSRPPSMNCLVGIAYRNLLPKYRRAMAEKLVETLEDIETFGRRFERQLHLDSRYAPPPPPEKMRVRGAAYISTSRSRDEVKEEVELSEEEKDSVVATERASQSCVRKERDERECESEKVHAVASISTVPLMDHRERVRSAAKTSVIPTNWRESSRNTAAQAREIYDPVWWKNFSTQRDSLCTREKAREFRGVCFSCKEVGHIASECHEVVCFVCHRKGHMIRDCPARRRPSALQSCVACGLRGVNYERCPSCEPLRSLRKKLSKQ